MRIPAFYAAFHCPGMQWVWSTYAANPHSIRGLSCNRESRFLLTETARIKQNRAENAKPSQFSRVFSEVPDSLRRDKGIQQAIIYSLKMLKKPGIRHFPGFFYAQNSGWTVRFWWNLNGNLWVYSGQITGGQAHFDLLWVKLLVDNRSKWSPILPSTDEHILDWFT